MKTTCLWLGMLLLCSITACKKDKPAEPATLETTVYGRVVLRGTELKATNLPCTVRAYREYYTSWVDKVKKLMGEAQTDTNGYYKLSFEADNLEKFEYHIELQTDIENHFSPKAGKHQIQPGQNQELKLNYTPFAWLRLHVRNINPQPGDIIRISFGGGVVLEYYGPANQQYIHMAGGNVNFEFPYTVERNGMKIQTIETIYLPAFDTIYHLIEY